MRKWNRHWWLVPLLSSLFAASADLIAMPPAWAFVNAISEQLENGKLVSLFWPKNNLPIPFFADSSGVSGSLSNPEMIAIINGFYHWQKEESAFIEFEYEGSVALNPATVFKGRDGLNSVSFWKKAIGPFPLGSTVVSVTLLEVLPSTGVILEADIISNGTDYDFNAVSETRTNHAAIRRNSTTRTVPGSPNPWNEVPAIIDIEAIITHEAGHFCGLDHSLIFPTNSRISDFAQYLPTMTPDLFPILGVNFDEQKILAPDDIAGIASIYPRPEFYKNYGIITGDVQNQLRQPIFGAQIEAIQGDITLVAAMSGFLLSDEGDGEYMLPGLPSGDYLVRVVPVDGQYTIGSANDLSYPWQNLENQFQPLYYDGESNVNEAKMVTVKAGAITPAIDFHIPLDDRPGSCGEPAQLMALGPNRASSNGIVALILGVVMLCWWRGGHHG